MNCCENTSLCRQGRDCPLRAKVAKSHRAVIAEIDKLLTDKATASPPLPIKFERNEAWEVVVTVAMLMLLFVIAFLVVGGALWTINYFL
jgi:hypothetical protein